MDRTYLFVLSFIYELFTVTWLQKWCGVLSVNIYKTCKVDTFNQMSIHLTSDFSTILR